MIANPVSTSPGFQIGNVFVLAGVPGIMQAMFDGLEHRLAGGRPVLTRTFSASIPEGVMAAPLAALQDRHPAVEIGSYPFLRRGRSVVSLVLRGPQAASIAAAAEDLVSLIRSLGAEPVEE